MRRILVVGGGIAGLEGALTLARGLPEDRVTLLTHSDLLRVMPDLVYVPTGVAAHRMEVPVRELLVDEEIDVVLGEVESIDLAAHVAHADTGDLPFDVVVVAPGAAPLPSGFSARGTNPIPSCGSMSTTSSAHGSNLRAPSA